MIELLGVTKAFGSQVALQRLDLTVPRGEIYGLLGHNGAGKSTAIGLMLGQLWPTAGQIRICGHDITSHRQLALRRVGAIFETPVFYDYLSGWRNLQIFSHYSAPTPAPRLRQVIDWVGLSGRERARVQTYSHGMRARLALAQALLPEPELLILDEPSDGLDPEGIHEMRQTILRLRQELGLTILLSSHLLTEVEQICTHIAVLKQGEKLFAGRLQDARRQRRWLRLRVDDFGRAARLLREQRLINDTLPDGRVAPADQIGSDEIVRCLVEHHLAVFEVVMEEETLEDFYLALMHSPGASSSGVRPESRAAGEHSQMAPIETTR